MKLHRWISRNYYYWLPVSWCHWFEVDSFGFEKVSNERLQTLLRHRIVLQKYLNSWTLDQKVINRHSSLDRISDQTKLMAVNWPTADFGGGNVACKDVLQVKFRDLCIGIWYTEQEKKSFHSSCGWFWKKNICKITLGKCANIYGHICRTTRNAWSTFESVTTHFSVHCLYSEYLTIIAWRLICELIF